MSGDAVPMNPMYNTLLDPKAPVLSGPSRAEVRKQASTVSAEPPQITKGKHSKIGGKTRRRGAGFMDKVRSVAKLYNNAEDEFAGDSVTDSIHNQSEMLARGDIKGLANTLRGTMNEIKDMRDTLRPTQQAGRKTLRNTTTGGDIVIRMLTIRNQIKLYHWQTREFSRHTATDALTLALDTNIDAFVESYMGRYGRPKVRGSIKLHNFSESAARAFFAKETKYLEKELPRKIGKGDSDLLNVRDTILAELTKVSYLFTLN